MTHAYYHLIEGTGVICYNDGVKRRVRPRLDLANHSPTGLSWGYRGSGPAQCALAILADRVKDERIVLENYQDFKNDIIAGLKMGESHKLSIDEIDKWISERVQTITIAVSMDIDMSVSKIAEKDFVKLQQHFMEDIGRLETIGEHSEYEFYPFLQKWKVNMDNIHIQKNPSMSADTIHVSFLCDTLKHPMDDIIDINSNIEDELTNARINMEHYTVPFLQNWPIVCPTVIVKEAEAVY